MQHCRTSLERGKLYFSKSNEITHDDILRVSRCIENRGNSSNPLGRAITRVGSVGFIASGGLFRVVVAIVSLEGADCVVQRLEEPVGMAIHTKIGDIA